MKLFRTVLFVTQILLVVGLDIPLLGQEPPSPPEAPAGPQPYWPVQPRRKPLVHSLFSEHMVLQRDVSAPIWGWGAAGEKIAVHVSDAQGNSKSAAVHATADAEGKWLARIGPFQAGEVLRIVVRGTTRSVEITDVIAGDVWLCSGQSNMNWPVRSSLNAEEEMRLADHPQIRSFTVPFCPSYVPLRTMERASWEVCAPKAVANFSGVGYFFAREIHAARKIPVGILHSSVGATTAEVWISPGGLRKHMPYDFHDQLAKLTQNAGDPGEDYFEACAKWTGLVDPESAAHAYVRADASLLHGWADVQIPKAWEETGLADFDGLVWFRTDFEVSSDAAGKPGLLSLGQIQDTDIVWFNGELVGVNQMKSAFRRYEIESALIRPGRNVITVAVINKSGPGGLTANVPKQVNLQIEAQAKAIELAGTWKRKAGPSINRISIDFPRPKLGYYKTLCGMDNGMIEPLVPFAIKGALWYQGEASWPFWMQYRRLLPALITDWRERFQVGDFPFLIVQLSTQGPKQTNPVEAGYGEIRESQWRTARTFPNTGLAVAVDIGDEPVPNIHPKNKQEVGRRLALVARRMVYGEPELETSGPEFTNMMLERIPDETPDAPRRFCNRLYFSHVGGGLVFKGDGAKPNGFAVSEDDKNYFWADAKIEGHTVVVSAPEVNVPRYVRYAWAYSPVVTLFSKEGLPAIPFRTVE